MDEEWVKTQARLIGKDIQNAAMPEEQKEAYNCFKSYGSAAITDEAFVFSTVTLEIIPIPPISATDIGSDRFANLKAELNRLLSIPAWELIELSRNDPSWLDYKEDIRTYSATDYTDQEIEICYIYCFELQD
ncbi:MAG: hypothetical protein ACI31N_06795 [Lacticaseibacillus absianus]